MTLDEIMAFAEADALEAPQATEWRIEGRDTLEWAMGRLAEDAEEIRRIDAEVDKAIARVKARGNELRAKVQKRGAFLNSKVEEYARTHRKDLLTGKSKTAGLIHGEIAYRTTPEKVEIENEEHALAWCQSQPVESDLVRVSYSINKRALNDYVKRGDIIPPGCAIVPGSETITIRPTQPEALDVAPSRKELKP